jgi:hypothetical protein
MLKFIFKKKVGACTQLIWLRIRGVFKQVDEPSGSIKCGEFVD